MAQLKSGSTVGNNAIVDTTDSRMSDSRNCNNSFDNPTTARTNMGLGSMATKSSVTESDISGTINANKLSGSLPALDGSSLTGLPGGGTSNGLQRFDSNGTWNWSNAESPSTVYVTLVGGGGGGGAQGSCAGDGYARGGTGGTGGLEYRKAVSCTGNLTVSVGGGGGGANCNCCCNNGSSGGSGGTSSISGGGSLSAAGGGGGGGGSQWSGAGSTGNNSGPGFGWFGAGGSGGDGGESCTSDSHGSAGANGLVIIEW